MTIGCSALASVPPGSLCLLILDPELGKLKVIKGTVLCVGCRCVTAANSGPEEFAIWCLSLSVVEDEPFSMWRLMQAAVNALEMFELYGFWWTCNWTIVLLPFRSWLRSLHRGYEKPWKALRFTCKLCARGHVRSSLRKQESSEAKCTVHSQELSLMSSFSKESLFDIMSTCRAPLSDECGASGL